MQRRGCGDFGFFPLHILEAPRIIWCVFPWHHPHCITHKREKNTLNPPPPTPPPKTDPDD